MQTKIQYHLLCHIAECRFLHNPNSKSNTHEAPNKMIIKLQDATLRRFIVLGDELSCMRSGCSSNCTFKPHEAKGPCWLRTLVLEVVACEGQPCRVQAKWYIDVPIQGCLQQEYFSSSSCHGLSTFLITVI